MISATCAPAWEATRAPAEARFHRVFLAAFAFGIATDVTIAIRLGSRGEGSLLVSLILGAPLAAAAGWRLVTEARVRPMPPVLVALLAFVAWSAATVFWALSAREVTIRSITNAQLFVFVWLASQLIRTERDLRAVLAGYVAGGLVLAALTWRSYLTGNTPYYERYAAEGFDPNDMSVYLALGIPMAAYLAVGGGRRRNMLALLYLPVAVSAVSLAGSRAGLISISIASVGVVLWVARSSRLALALTVALLFGAMSFVATAVPAETLDRLFSAEEEVMAGTLGERTGIWRFGAAVFIEHPVLGIGAGCFPTALARASHVRNVAHSTPLSIAVETGAIGLALFLAGLALVLWSVRRCARDERILAWSLVLTLVVGTASLTWEYRKATWLVFLIGAMLGGIRKRDAAAG
jgi:O-antigen ligase